MTDEVSVVTSQIAALDAQAVIIAERINRQRRDLNRIIVQRKLLAAKKTRLLQESNRVA